MSAVPTRVGGTSNTSRRAPTQTQLLQTPLLPHPIIPLLPLPILQPHSPPLIPHQLPLPILPRLRPPTAAPIPARFAHQANERLVFRPLLLFGDAGEVRRAVAAGLGCERDADAVGADGPVVGVAGGGGEVCEEGDVDGEVGEKGCWDGGEAGVFEGAGWCVSCVVVLEVEFVAFYLVRA